MNEKELEAIKILKVEADRIELVIQELESTEEAGSIVEEYKNKLIDRKTEIIKKKIEIETYLNSIEDSEIRIIILLRYVDLKSWSYIGKKLHCDRTLPYYKLKNFFKKNRTI